MKKLLASLGFGLIVLSAPVMASAQDSAKDILQHYKSEPTVEATMQAALEYAGISPERMESLYTRAQASRALPKKVSYEFTTRLRDTDRPQTKITYDSASKPTSTVVTQYVEDQDYDQHKVRAEWELSGLVYNTDTLNVYKQMGSVSKERDRILRDVTKIYFARRKQQIAMEMDESADVMTRLQQELQLQELTAQLDALTGGWFSKQLKK